MVKNNWVPGKKVTRENFSISKFSIWNTFWNILTESLRTKKIDQKFLSWTFFHYFIYFCRKTTESQEKILYGENFRFQVFAIFGWKIFHQKWFSLLFRTNFFDFRQSITSLSQVSSFLSTFWDFLLRKWRFCQVFIPKKFFWKKIFVILLHQFLPIFLSHHLSW